MKFLSILFVFFNPLVFAHGNPQPPSDLNVILVMWDGVRVEEFFDGVDPKLDGQDTAEIFPYLWGELAPSGVVFGRGETAMVVSNPMNISLPAYHSIMGGRQLGCLTNNCPRISEETFPERFIRELGLARLEVATIASWGKMPLAVEHVEGSTFVNAGISPLADGADDEELKTLNREQEIDPPPWKGVPTVPPPWEGYSPELDTTRWDKYTFRHAMRYIQLHQPRFLFISLNDSDDLAHRNLYKTYLETLRQYDRGLRELVTLLEKMGDYGKRTCLLVTTDHGRGKDAYWTEHGPHIPSSRYAWFYGKTPFTGGGIAKQRGHYSHADIRPTIERLFGLSPTECKGCGKVMSELVGDSLLSESRTWP